MSGGGEYKNLRDMIDGGGAGQSGPEFEGGGILSAIANEVASPLGSLKRGAQGQGVEPVVSPLISPTGVPAPAPVTSTPLPPPMMTGSDRPMPGMVPQPVSNTQVQPGLPQYQDPAALLGSVTNPVGRQVGDAQRGGQTAIDSYYQMLEMQKRGLLG